MIPPSSTRSEITSLTALRGVAAMWVVLYHLRSHVRRLLPGVEPYVSDFTKSGYLGVDLFFVLSGFVIAYMYFDVLRPFAWGNYAGFLRKRLARIYPAYLVIIVVVTGARVWHDIAHYSIASKAAKNSLKVLGKQLLMVHGWGLPVRKTVNLTTWSVSEEWLAYLLFPLVAMLVARLRSAQAVLLGAVFYGSLGVVVFDHLDRYEPVQVGLLRIVFAFPLGMLAYRLYSMKPEPSRPWALGAMALLLSFGPASQYFMQQHDVPPVATAGIVFSLVVYGLARCDFAWTARPFPRWLGHVSYCLYLVHGAVIGAIGRQVSVKQVAAFGTLAAVGYLVACVLVSMACAHALHAWVERPWQARLAGPRVSRPSKF